MKLLIMHFSPTSSHFLFDNSDTEKNKIAESDVV
jgi:hypothetical protein